MSVNWTPHFHSKVVGILYTLPEKMKRLFWKTIEALKKNPYRQNAMKRAGYAHVYDLPVDGYVLVYEIQENTHSFRVLDFTLP